MATNSFLSSITMAAVAGWLLAFSVMDFTNGRRMVGWAEVGSAVLLFGTLVWFH